MQLQYIPHYAIDFIKWDAALAKCNNQLIYAQSTYLNTMCTHWDALVADDFTFIMPLPYKKKMGFKYIPMIPFVQQLGIFSSKEITSSIISQFLEVLQKKIKLVDLLFNYANTIEGTTQNNFILPLQGNYENLYANYKNDVKKDLKKSIKSLTIDNNYNIHKAVDFFKEEYQSRMPHLKDHYINKFKLLCEQYKTKEQLICKAAIVEGDRVASAILIKDHNRIYNVASTINTKGKKLNANHFLFDDLIQTYANTAYTLDFEGSDIEGVAYFYQQFGAINQPYTFYHYNNLNPIVKLLKK
jgi:hypothetical protein